MSESPITKQTVLEEGTEVEGSIRSQCPITVSGTLKGDIAAPSLTITLSGSIHGQVKVSNFKSEGETAGEIDAESVELSGHVSDQTTIRASSLQVKLSQNGSSGKLQVTFGNCDLHVGGGAASTALLKVAPKSVDEQPNANRNLGWNLCLMPNSRLSKKPSQVPGYHSLRSRVLSVVGIILVAVGPYVVLSYSVVQRAREKGIRLALGRDRWEWWV